MVKEAAKSGCQMPVQRLCEQEVCTVRSEYYFDSVGEGKIHCCRWTPEGDVKAVVQIVHGIAEYVLRYDDFAKYLNSLGFLVVAEDHMGHGASMDTGTKGYFAGGWFAAVADTYHLLKSTMKEFSDVPYFLFGHSMGSFMTRTILAKYPDSGIAGAVICGTGWQPKMILAAGRLVAAQVCKKKGEKNPSELLENMAFGTYNKKVEHRRTKFDWLSRDDRVVDAYIADPLCGQTASAGLMRDMLGGIAYNQDPANLASMRKDLPVLFIAGKADPVGAYGKGVQRTAEAFQKAGVRDVTVRLYPMGRHEILNEINRQEVYEDAGKWLTFRLERTEAHA